MNNIDKSKEELNEVGNKVPKVNSKKKLKKKLCFFFMGITTIVAGLGGTYIYKSNEIIKSYENLVYPNIYVNDVDVTGLSKNNLIKVIEDEVNDFNDRKISINISDYSVEKTLEDFNPVYKYGDKDNIDDLVDVIMGYGKSESFFNKLNLIKNSPKNDYKISYIYDNNIVDELTETISKKIYVKRVEPTLTMTSYGHFNVTEGRDGYSIDNKDLSKKINNELSKVSKDDIEIKMEKTVDERKRKVSLLKSVNKKISSYSTKYTTGNSRASNVELATRKINDTVLMPGEEFSYEKAISPITKANGYKEGGAYSNGKVIKSVGGGVCQVSSTLYNAQLKAGIIATQRRNHSMPVSYVPLGQDATMSTGYLDLKFKNTYDFPIYINSYCKDGNVIIEFWSNENATNGIEYSVYSKVYGNGLKADTYLYGYKDGVKVVDKFLHTSTYKPLS